MSIHVRGSTASRCLNREATGGEEKEVREGGQVDKFHLCAAESSMLSWSTLMARAPWEELAEVPAPRLAPER